MAAQLETWETLMIELEEKFVVLYSTVAVYSPPDCCWHQFVSNSWLLLMLHLFIYIYDVWRAETIKCLLIFFLSTKWIIS